MAYVDLNADKSGRVTVSDLIGKLEDNGSLFKSVQDALRGMEDSLKKSVFHGCVQKYLGLWGEYYDMSQTFTTRSKFIFQLSIAFIDEFLVSYGTDDFNFFENPTTQIHDKQIRILQDISKKADRFNKHAISLKLDFLLLKEDVSEFSGNMRQEFDDEKTAFVKKTKESIDALNNKAEAQLGKGAISSVVSDIGVDMMASGVGAPLGFCLWAGGTVLSCAYTGKALMAKWDCCKENLIVKEAEAHNKTVVDGLESCKETIKGIGERLEKFAERWKEKESRGNWSLWERTILTIRYCWKCLTND
ncbi:hypothetical protein DFH11DRAFT_1261534 [Phellopilus nigrolimitatus]|nr:hypothetical protein DFH11DRAFT_1261534 [Phellopilus nigrolimitatus]